MSSSPETRREWMIFVYHQLSNRKSFVWEERQECVLLKQCCYSHNWSVQMTSLWCISIDGLRLCSLLLLCNIQAESSLLSQHVSSQSAPIIHTWMHESCCIANENRVMTQALSGQKSNFTKPVCVCCEPVRRSDSYIGLSRTLGTPPPSPLLLRRNLCAMSGSKSTCS